MKSPAPCILAVASLACLSAGCGDADTAGTAATPAATQTGAATITAPSALQRNTADADRLVGEGPVDLRTRLASLKGHPVVVNQWASWCGPCRFEFPFFAAAVKRYGSRVAFVGIDYLDSRDGAQAFLDEQPPGFPSVYDGDGKASRAIGGSRVTPTTLFLGPDGRVRHTKLGGYPKASALDDDIRRYALGST